MRNCRYPRGLLWRAGRVVRRRARRHLRRRACAGLLVVPLVVVPVVALLVLTTGSERPQPAGRRRRVGRTFHPVAGDFVADATPLADCAGAYSCLEQAFGNIAFDAGPSRRSPSSRRARPKPDVERDCHRIVHLIGSAALARFDGDVARTFAEGSPVCVSGYYHGILERAFVGISTKAELARVARELCVGVGIRRRGFLDYQCRHGLGHGLHDPDGLRPSHGAVALQRSRHGLGSRDVHERRVHGERQHAVRVPLALARRRGSALSRATASQREHRRSCYLRATSWILPVDEERLRARRAATCARRGTQWAPRVLPRVRARRVAEARYATSRRSDRSAARAARHTATACFGAARTIRERDGLGGMRARAARCLRASPHCASRDCLRGARDRPRACVPLRTRRRERAACARADA